MIKILTLATLVATTATATAIAQEQTWNWSGAYIGVHAGYSLDNSASRDTNSFISDPFGAFLLQPGHVSGTNNRNFASRFESALGGAQVGYNLQAGRLVFGAEADISFGAMDKDAGESSLYHIAGGLNADGAANLNMNVGDSITIDQNRVFSARHSIGPYGTVRGRIGVAFNRYLVYATGGLVVADMRSTASHVSSSQLSNNIVAANPAFAALNSTSRADAKVSQLGFGGVIGLGLEAQLTPSWSLKTEYLYHSLPTQQISLTLAGATRSATFRNDFHVLRVGLNYRF